MLLCHPDEQHRLLPASPTVAVRVLGDVDHQRLHLLDADRSQDVALPVQEVEGLVRSKFDLKLDAKIARTYIQS